MTFHQFVIRAVLITMVATLTNCSIQPGTREEGPNSPQVNESHTGLASFYGEEFQGKVMASGESFNKSELVAAHPSYPVGTLVRVTNL